ncbi:MAG: nucleotidyltransferase family protein [Candidatus Sumerlaeota bacterium]|nr:nucleotidyltransferase family protein [Candidatus Sumerlaeota bacterium]
MDKNEALNTIRQHAGEIRSKYGVEALWLFGSVARNEARETSDADILVQFESPATFRRFMGLRFYLEDLLGMRVDLVTRKALRPQLQSAVEQEAIRAA